MMIKKNLIFFLIIFLLSCKSDRDFNIIKIKESNPIFTNQKYEFPILDGDSIISEKINSKIILDFLDLDVKEKHGSIFEKVWGTKEYSIPKLSFSKYTINLLNKKIYSVTIYAEGCGAYCEEFEISYNFDLTTGNEILLDSILKKDARKAFLKILNNQKKAILKNKIVQLNQEKRQSNINDNHDFEDRILLLQNCLQNSSINSFEYLDFKIMKDSLTIFSERCSNHAMRALDEVGRFEYNFKIKEIDNLFNSFGKNLYN